MAHNSRLALSLRRLRIGCFRVFNSKSKHALVLLNDSAYDSFAERAATFVSVAFSAKGTLWIRIKNIALTLLLADSARIKARSLDCIFVFKTCIGFHRTIPDNNWPFRACQLILPTRSRLLKILSLHLLVCLSV